MLYMETTSPRAYSLTKDENITYNMGEMGGVNSTFDIFGNKYNINQNGNEGITVLSGQTLNVKDVGSLNADGTVKSSWKNNVSTIFTNNGNINIDNSVFENNSATRS